MGRPWLQPPVPSQLTLTSCPHQVPSPVALIPGALTRCPDPSALTKCLTRCPCPVFPARGDVGAWCLHLVGVEVKQRGGRGSESEDIEVEHDATTTHRLTTTQHNKRTGPARHKGGSGGVHLNALDCSWVRRLTTMGRRSLQTQHGGWRPCSLATST